MAFPLSILAAGRYQWAGGQGRKQALFSTLPDGKPFAFAGLWETWSGRAQTGEALRSCAILIPAASPSIPEIRHHEPMILKLALYSGWLDQEREPVNLDRILREGAYRGFESTPCSKRSTRY